MIRVLHLNSIAPDLSAERASKLLERIDTSAFQITRRTIGHGGDYRNTAHAATALRLGGADFDLIHAWNPSSLIGAVAARGPIVYSGSAALSAVAAGWIARIMRFRSVQVVCPSQASWSVHVRRGVPAANCHVIRPGVDPPRNVETKRHDIRKAIGLEPGEYALLAPDELTPATRLRPTFHAASILHVLDRRFRLLWWGCGRDAAARARLAARLRQPHLLVVVGPELHRGVTFEELLSAADVALFTATAGASPLPMLMCMAGGVPIVAPATPLAEEFILEGRTGTISPTAAPRQFVRKVLDLVEQPDFAAKLAEAARLDVTSRFTPAAYCANVQALYRRTLDLAGGAQTTV